MVGSLAFSLFAVVTRTLHLDPPSSGGKETIEHREMYIVLNIRNLQASITVHPLVLDNLYERY